MNLHRTIADGDCVGGGVVDYLGCEGFVNYSRTVDINAEQVNFAN